MNREELDELSSVVLELRRIINFFAEDTETNLYVEDDGETFMRLIDDETGNRYMVKISKIQ